MHIGVLSTCTTSLEQISIKNGKTMSTVAKHKFGEKKQNVLFQDML